MIINNVYTKKFCGQLHDSIYGTLDRRKGVKAKLDDPPAGLMARVSLPENQKANLKKAYRVALLFSYYQQFLHDLMDRGQDIDLITENVEKLLGCHPYGVFFKEPPKGTGYDCKRYSVCPWCRFRKVHELTQKLIPLLSEAKQLAYITLSAPASFLESRDPLADDVGDTLMSSNHEEYKAMISILCKKQGLFFADRVITLPNWRKTSDVNDPVMRYSFNIETTIIGLMDEKKELPLPENCISKARQAAMPFFGVGRGTWSIMKPTQKSLHQVVSQTMGFSPALLSKHLPLEEYCAALELQSKFKAVGHGKARSRSSQRTA